MDKVVAALIECAKQGRGLVAKNLKLSMMHLVSAIPGPTANEGVEGGRSWWATLFAHVKQGKRLCAKNPKLSTVAWLPMCHSKQQ